MCTEKNLEYMVDCIYFKILLRVWQNRYGIDKPCHNGIDKPCQKTNICQYRNKLFILKFIIKFVFYASV